MDAIFIYDKKLIFQEYNLYRFSWLTKRRLRLNMKSYSDMLYRRKLYSEKGILHKHKYSKKRYCFIINVGIYKMIMFTQLSNYYDYKILRKFLKIFIKKHIL